jgi:dihydrofolate reductase
MERLEHESELSAVRRSGPIGSIVMTPPRRIIVHIGTSADGYIARPDGDLEWLTSRPKPPGFYGIAEFMKSTDTMILGRKTYEAALRLGGKFDARGRTIVCSRQSPPGRVPPGVEFTDEAIAPLVSRLRGQPGKNVWLMGGGEIIASFLDQRAIDEFVVTIAPVFIGDGIPLLARRHRHTALELLAARPFEDGVVQLHYRVRP